VRLTFAAALVVGALLISCGAFTAAWRRERGAALMALPMLAAGAAVCMAGVSRFSAGAPEIETGQEMAVLISVTGLASAILGAAWADRKTVHPTPTLPRKGGGS
jgi:hypothetical protein